MDEGGSGDGVSLSEEALCGGGLVGSSFTGDPGKYVKKVSRYARLLLGWPLFQLRGTWYVGGSHILGTLIDESRRAVVVGHICARVSMKGTLGEGSFTGEPER